MTVLVTGATGFIGGRLTRTLLGQGAEVRLIVRPTSQVPDEYLRHAEVVYGDLAEGPLPEAFRDVEVVFHCAAQVQPTRDPIVYYRNNVLATRYVLEASRPAEVPRVVHFSSVAVHGEHIDHHEADESAPMASPPPTPYVATKIAAENLVEEARQEGLDVVTLRPGWVWGPEDRSTLRIVRQLRRGWFPLPGDGKNVLHLAFIDNVVQAARLAAKSKEASSETFLIHDNHGVTARGLLERLSAALGLVFRMVQVPVSLLRTGAALLSMADFKWVEGVTPYQVDLLAHDQGFSTGKARTTLGFRPSVSFEEAIQKTVAWVRGAS